MTVPFCDWLTVTTSLNNWDGLRASLSPVLDSLGLSVITDSPGHVLWRPSDAPGAVVAKRLGRIWVLSCSGSVIAGLRFRGLWGAYLSCIAERSHRVTRLDASADLAIDAAPVVDRVAKRGRAGKLSLTRKGIKPQHVETQLSLRFDGVLTGTVRLGAKNADVRMMVYDKQHERLQKGFPDCGHLVRYELTLRSGTGITLRDAMEPAAVFWHYASPDFLPAPPDAPVWVGHGSGFVMDHVSPLLPAERLRRRVQSSAEIASLMSLASEVGPYGLPLLLQELLRHPNGRVWAQPTGTALSALWAQSESVDAALLPACTEDPHRA